ncbi:Mov34/MPN/PAD-1 family protein [Elioraea thermophila]|uniref:Mov34/MPN/PAD-1 family protein n=1 Tax=Elioraea thermophila TaxID=2185104 RepID=UPI000DF1E592|nr:M67 family metallopeptidase [Elioraea thermophila]
MIVVLPGEVAAALPRLADLALPREACGLLVGRTDEESVRITGFAPSRNLAAAPDAFEIDTSLHLVLQRRLRARGEAVVGVWHSHPSGAALPSARDAAGAWQDGLIWLITAGAETTAWVARGGGFVPARLVMA